MFEVDVRVYLQLWMVVFVVVVVVVVVVTVVELVGVTAENLAVMKGSVTNWRLERKWKVKLLEHEVARIIKVMLW
jgi:hypothetical protein